MNHTNSRTFVGISVAGIEQAVLIGGINDLICCRKLPVEMFQSESICLKASSPACTEGGSVAKSQC